MKTYGDPQTQTLVSVDTDDEGNPIALDAALVPLVKTPAPTLTAAQKAQPVLVWFNDRVERQWEQFAVTIPKPSAVTMVSLRLALIDADLYSGVTSAINGIANAKEKLKAQTWWDTATTVRRNHPLVAAIAAMAGKESDDIDAIFAAAQELDQA